MNDVVHRLTLTGGERGGDSLAEGVVQVRVENGSVLGLWSQIPQRELGDCTWDPLLHGVVAFNAHIEAVASDNGTGGLPQDHCTVVANVSETQAGWRIGFWLNDEILGLDTWHTGLLFCFVCCRLAKGKTHWWTFLPRVAHSPLRR